MESSEIEHLKKMANEIAANLGFAVSQEQQIADLASHLQRFWAPSMKKRLQAYARAGGEGLSPAVIGAVKQLDRH